MNVSAFPFGTWHIKNCLNLLMHQFRYGASSFGLEERSSVSVFLLCILDMSSSSLSSPLNIAWANRTVDGWNCICGERLSVLREASEKETSRRQGQEASRGLPWWEGHEAVGSNLAASTATRNAKRLETRNVATCEPKRLRHKNGHPVT